MRPTVRFHGLHLDLAARRLTDPQLQEIILTTLEFDVLAALLDHTNMVLSRDQIISHVRGPGWIIDDRSIDGLVSRLRKLFPEGSGMQKIKTVRGIGYMLSL